MTDDPAVLRLGDDPRRVSAFADLGTEVTARVLLPVLGPGEASWSWGALTQRAGIPLSATTRWSQLVRRLGTFAAEVEPPYASLAPEGVRALARVLGRATATPDECVFALWDGYAGEADGLAPAAEVRGLAALARPFGGLVLHEAPLSWLVLRAAAHPTPRLPVFVRPRDGAFLVACPVYHDSLYVSGSRGLVEAVGAAGFEILPVDRDAPLPSERD